MSIMGSLGLENVSADPNDVPDGKYAGVVFKDEYVYLTNDDSVSHVITYRVEDGEHKGAQRAEWFKLGVNPTRDQFENIVGLDVTMDDTKRRWYKKRLVDLGVPEDQIANLKPGDLTGKPVNFGVKRNGQYINVNFVELRTGGSVTQGLQTEAPTGAITGAL